MGLGVGSGLGLGVGSGFTCCCCFRDKVVRAEVVLVRAARLSSRRCNRPCNRPATRRRAELALLRAPLAAASSAELAAARTSSAMRPEAGLGLGVRG